MVIGRLTQTSLTVATQWRVSRNKINGQSAIMLLYINIIKYVGLKDRNTIPFAYVGIPSLLHNFRLMLCHGLGVSTEGQ